MALPLTKRKTNPATDLDTRLSDQIDNLQQIASTERNDIYGEDFFRSQRALYTLNRNDRTASPSFRPRVIIPELQTIAQLEASDLSDIEPQPHLIKSRDTFERDNANEIALQAQCRESEVLLRWMDGLLWAFLCGTSFLQVGWDPYAYRGRGSVTVDVRDPEDVYIDPYARRIGTFGGPGAAKFVVLEDYMWLDEVRSTWPKRAWLLTENRMPRTGGTVLGVGSMSPGPMAGPLSFPAGPMRSVGTLPTTPTPGDGRKRVRTLFIYDPTVVENKGAKLDDTLRTDDLPEPTIRMLYPRGRMMIECDRIILYDSQNPYQHGCMPLVALKGMPALHSFWAPSPARYTQTLQDIGQRFWTQLFENCIRLNNGVWFAYDDSGIDFNKFGGVPGEVQMLAAGSKPPELKMPTPIPQHMVQLPELAFEIQRRLQGFPDSRTGKTPPGNVSPGFLENAVQQAHGLTRMRAKLQYSALRDLYHLIFQTMAQFYSTPRKFYNPDPGQKGFVEWDPIPSDKLEDYELFMDPDSIMPFSQQLMANRVPIMRNMGLISVKGALKAMHWPNADEEWQEVQKEAAAAAQAAEAKKARSKTGSGKR